MAEDGDKAKQKSTALAGAVAIAKDIFSLLRDSALFFLAVLLILFPSTLNSVLVKAGFKEGTVAGFKWEANLVNSDAALKEARATIAGLQKKSDDEARILGQAYGLLTDAGLKADIAKLMENNKQLLANTQQVEATVATTIASNAPLVEKALASGTSSGPTGRWGVVWSGDSTLASARYEVEVYAPKAGIPNPAVYFRQGSYRSVSVVVGNKSEADQVLSKAQKRRQDAYVVNLATWCPAPNQKDGYLDCQGQ